MLLLHDDSEHTFYDVASALEALGMTPPVALLLTQEVNDFGVNCISKGSMQDVNGAAQILRARGLNASVVSIPSIDAQIIASAWRVHVNISDAARLRRDVLPECPIWALAGACTRHPLAMHTRCEASCTLLSRNFLQAAIPREVPSLASMAVSQLSLLGMVMLAAGLIHKKSAPRCRNAGLMLATALISAHFFIDGLSGLLLATQAGFVVDDSEGVMIVDRLVNLSATPPMIQRPAEDEVTGEAPGWLWSIIGAAALNLANGLSHAPRWTHAMLAGAQLTSVSACVALACAARRHTLMLVGALLGAFALVGAGHVVLSALVMYTLGAGLHLSELMAKKLTLVGAVALWIGHIHRHGVGDRGDSGDEIHSSARLPLLPTTSPSKCRPHQIQPQPELGIGSGLLLMLGRMAIACLLLVVCGTELARLILTPLTYLGTDGTASRLGLDDYQSHLVHEHGEIVLRGPQLLLSLPLSVGAGTSRVATALTILLLIESFVVWQWWRSETFIDPVRLAHCVEHFTVNLAVIGGLILLSLRGPGQFAVDEFIKKRD